MSTWVVQRLSITKLEYAIFNADSVSMIKPDIDMHNLTNLNQLKFYLKRYFNHDTDKQDLHESAYKFILLFCKTYSNINSPGNL